MPLRFARALGGLKKQAAYLVIQIAQEPDQGQLNQLWLRALVQI